ncbi:Rho GTPase activation protein [Yamadazyma tenuis ATCC 10573]|uniref:Rho GTPase activation protein n=1 Tax=Candida tenuis (strain ATCC 10573 / BCRC 21748 / CBS 615 / JCM 9827 / NBRC 10315 / NRRL Y-1498 / VKM Y-70) TaxID=590646 RepID=G3B920_CANTC|nr:Rho GTPase activation protein [Yamadazyma tenuis ATCC 10573]EGV62440.1 Rho GTPase activation protein [Yamadazyma tenuis ATCC 10573]
MAKQTAFHRLIARDKGIFNGRDFLISSDSITWVPAYAIFITEQGQLYSADENDNNYLLLQFLQSCYIQVIPNINTSTSSQLKKSRSRLAKPSKDSSTLHEVPPPVVFIKTFDNEKLYIKVPSKNNFGNLLSSLLVWQNLNPKSLVKKWYCENKFVPQSPDFIHEVLVCRFKVYGPVVNRGKNMNLVKGPKVPNHSKNLFVESETGTTQSPVINEGWFYTMGVLKSNGVLNFITELDGTLIYSIDIKTIMSSEVREMHHSIFDNSNVLFVGRIKELRWNNLIKNKSSSINDQVYPPFIAKDGKTINSYNRILIEFPLHIDLEDWFVGLNYFSKREYIGSYNPKTAINKSNSVNDIIKKSEDLALNDNQTLKDSFRISKKLSVDIIEAKFDNEVSSKSKIYAEVVMWGLPWSRTAIVNYTNNPFWKEEFSTDLPISTQIIHILIKECSFNESSYSEGDKIVGTVYITPDILTRHFNNHSTMSIEGISNGNAINVSGMNNGENPNYANDIVKLSIYDASNLPIGKLLVNVNFKEYHILSPKNFKPLENMLHNAPMTDLIEFCNSNVSTAEFENVSIIMLDIFQSLGIEDKWFKALMDAELINVDKVTRQNYVSKASTPSSSSNNVFNTLFRGSSIFSKSLEKYNLRIGQEYLEKVFGDFFAIIDKEKKNCEVDPRYVRLQEKAERKGKNVDDTDSEDSDEEDDGYDSDEEARIDKRVKAMVEHNSNNLYEYAEMLWQKIYITSNDLPEQIKSQLKQFRNKVELACDPNDKITALNCLSAFIFLRFFCPAILNPKLFYLTKNHQTGRSQRTLTLIAKILLNLANRQEFSPHKEPHLVQMNKFLDKHKEEVLDYFDKITGRKNDFHEKILELSHEVKRFDLGLSGDTTSNELPTTPYLIDKYLRLTELIYLLENKTSGGTSEDDFVSPIPEEAIISDKASTDESRDQFDFNSVSTSKFNNRRTKLNGINESDIRIRNNVYKIGSLEFEKSEFLDLAGEDETESFIKSLCKSDENIFSFITSNITLKDLQKTSNRLRKRILELESFLSNYEYPANYQSDQTMWDAFANRLLSTSYLDLNRSCVVQWEDYNGEVPLRYKRIVDNGLNYLKLKFFDEAFNGEPGLTTSYTLHNHLGDENVLKSPSSKNPFKKWFNKP